MFAVRPRFGRAPVPEILADGVRAALEGTLPLAERLRQREADYRQDGVRSAPPRISWHNGEVSGAATGIVEVRAGDRAGLLYRLTAAITGEGLDVTSARIETLGADAVDCFYVANPSGTPVDAEQRRRVDDALDARPPAGAAVAGGGRHAGLSCPESVVRACDRRRQRGTERSPGREEPPWTAARGPARPVARSASSSSRRASTGTPTTAGTAPSGPAPTAASAVVIGDAGASPTSARPASAA